MGRVLATLLASCATVVSIASAQLISIPVNQTCDPTRNRLSSTSHQFRSDCVAHAYCDPTELICKPKGCRSEEFPFGYPPDTPLPDFCPDGSFCPDEEDRCLPIQQVGTECQLNRDDQCQPAPNAGDIASKFNHQGAICLHFSCYWQNVTVGNPCVIDNVVYTGFRANGSSFGTIVSRDNCLSPNLYCDGESLTCKTALDFGVQCTSDKMCLSRNCGLNNQCILPAGTVKKIPIYQYIITGVGIVVFIVGILVTLFFLHKHQRKNTQKEIREYFHEQTTYRSSIIALHTAARERTSIYGGSTSTFSHYDEHGNLVYNGDDQSERHLLGNTNRHSRLRESVVFDEEEDDEERAQNRGLLGANNGGYESRDSLDQTPRQSYDYGQGSSSSYNPVPMRGSFDLPVGASAPPRSEFKDPWGGGGSR